MPFYDKRANMQTFLNHFRDSLTFCNDIAKKASNKSFREFSRGNQHEKHVEKSYAHVVLDCIITFFIDVCANVQSIS